MYTIKERAHMSALAIYPVRNEKTGSSHLLGKMSQGLEHNTPNFGDIHQSELPCLSSQPSHKFKSLQIVHYSFPAILNTNKHCLYFLSFLLSFLSCLRCFTFLVNICYQVSSPSHQRANNCSKTIHTELKLKHSSVKRVVAEEV